MNRVLTRFSLACVATLTLTTTACSNNQTGNPTPAPSSTSTSPTTASSAEGDAALADLKACDLLTDDEVTQIGLTNPGKAAVKAGADTCSWNVSGNGGLLVAVEPNAGVDDLNFEGSTKQPITVGKLNATKVAAHQGAKYACHVVIELSSSSSIHLVANLRATSTDTAAACSRATDAANLIAPKLP